MDQPLPQFHDVQIAVFQLPGLSILQRMLLLLTFQFHNHASDESGLCFLQKTKNRINLIWSAQTHPHPTSLQNG